MGTYRVEWAIRGHSLRGNNESALRTAASIWVQFNHHFFGTPSSVRPGPHTALIIDCTIVKDLAQDSLDTRGSMRVGKPAKKIAPPSVVSVQQMITTVNLSAAAAVATPERSESFVALTAELSSALRSGYHFQLSAYLDSQKKKKKKSPLLPVVNASATRLLNACQIV